MAAPALRFGSKAYGPHVIVDAFGTVCQQIVAPQIELPYYQIIVQGQAQDAQTLPGDSTNLNIFCKLFTTNTPAPAVPIRYWFLFTINWLSIHGAQIIYQGMWDLALRDNILFKWVAPTGGHATYPGQVNYVIASEMLKVDGTVSTTFAPAGVVSFDPTTTEASFTKPGAPGVNVTWSAFNSGRPSY